MVLRYLERTLLIMETYKSKRIFEYDLMRVLFSLMVLGIHILAKIRGLAKPYNTTWYFVNIITNFFMICNPLFLCLAENLACIKPLKKKKTIENTINQNL